MAERIRKRIHLSEVDSTNVEVRRRLEAGEPLPELTLVDADNQTQGRGQRGNSWESEAGQNLSFSLVCHPQWVKASEQFVLSQAIALAVAENVDGTTVKWPNDIYIGDRKVSGTLIECDLRGSQIETCIIGTGVNVNQTEFRSDAPNPVSMAQVAGHTFDRETLLQAIVQRFVLYYEKIRNGQADEVRQAYRQCLYRRTGFHPYADAQGEFLAEIADVERTGHLILRKEDGTLHRYEFKEVRFLIHNA